MRFTQLEIDNFMSVRHVDVDLSSRGLVLIQGENRSSSSMESNGAGKSTIFSESITWVLFGETLRGLKGDEIVKLDEGKPGKDTSVSLTIVDDDNTEYTVIRHRKHKKHKNQVLLFKGKEDITEASDASTNAKIVNLIDMDFLTFTNSVLFGQGISKMFAESTDSQQKAILERMLQIDIFQKCAEMAKEHMATLLTSRASIQGNIDSLSREISTLDATLKDLQIKEAELHDKVRASISNLQENKIKQQQELDSISDEQLLADLTTFETLVSATSQKIEAFRDTQNMLNSTNTSIGVLGVKINELKNKCKQNSNRIAELKAGKDVPDLCKLCGQKIPKGDTTVIEKHLQEEKDKWLEEIADYYNDLESYEEDKIDLLKKLEERKPLEDTLRQLQDEVASIRADIRNNESRRKTISTLIQSYDKQIKEQEKILEETYTDLINQTIHKIGVCDHDVNMFQVDLQRVDDEYAKYKFWQDAFGNQGIKSVLLDSVTPFLNERANEYIGNLSDSTINIEFCTQKTLKSGEKRDKFEVIVENEHGHNIYKGNSGGEKRRVDIAIALALQDLVSSRSNKQIGLCLYDEAFDGLDAIGCERVIQLLKEKQLEKETILVITHNDSLKVHFDNAINVIKRGDTTTIV